MNRRLEALLTYLFPSTPDDLMDLADAVGVTAETSAYDLDEPIPYVLTDRSTADAGELRVEHEAICTLTEAMAEERRLTLGGRCDFNLWETEVWFS
ncbi:hypothetical protein GCM10027273_45120 [Nocardioides pakistanensis]